MYTLPAIRNLHCAPFRNLVPEGLRGYGTRDKGYFDELNCQAHHTFALDLSAGHVGITQAGTRWCSAHKDHEAEPTTHTPKLT